MSEVRGCRIPEDLYYWIEKHVWVRPEGHDVVTIGITDPAQKLAAKIVAVTPKRVGRSVEHGQSVATVESGKWVGPVPTPLHGEIVAVNEALATNPGLANSDPYGEGWIVKLKASLWSVQHAALHTGGHAVEEYRALLEREGISCG